MIASSTIAIIGAVAAVAGAGVGAYSAVAQGQAAEKASKFNSAVARNNAIMAQQQSQYEATQIRKRGLLVEAAQRSKIGKSGMEIGSGSGADLEYDSQIQNERDALAALYTGRVSANSQESRARLSALEGQNAVTSSYWNAGSTILSGAGRAAGSYGDYQKTQPQFG